MGGYDVVDNGFARFERVRIPKWHMLSKFAQVTDDGKYVKPPHAKISYGGVRCYRIDVEGQVTYAEVTDALHTVGVRKAHYLQHSTSELTQGRA